MNLKHIAVPAFALLLGASCLVTAKLSASQGAQPSLA